MVRANPKYDDAMLDQSRYLPILGGRSSGKSHFAAQKLVRRCSWYPHRFLALRKTNKSARRSVFQIIDDYNRKFGLVVEKNRTELTFEYSNGAQIYCSGLDDPSKVKSFEGCTGIWWEEGMEFEEKDFLELDPIMRGEHDCYLQHLFTFNPTDPYHWLRDYFFTGDNAYLQQAHPIEATVDDNVFATELDLQTLENLKGMDDQLYEIYRYGRWAILANLIYSNWDIVDEIPTLDDVFYGMDFNFAEPYAIAEYSRLDNEIFCRELYYDKVEDPNEMLEMAKQVITNKNAIIYADSSRPELVKMIGKEFPYTIGVDKPAGSVLNGIDVVKKYKLHVLKSSLNFLKEIRSYKRREIKGRIIDEPAKFNDHLMDTLRYAIMEHLGKSHGSGLALW